MLFLGAILFLIGIIRCICNKKIIGYSTIFIVLGVLILVISLINLNTQIKKIVISNNTLRQISEIDWSDENYLIESGFQKYEQKYYLIDTINDIPFRIIISKPQTELSEKDKYENITYEFEETSAGKFSIKRIWIDEIPVVRRYIVHANGMEIWMLEDSIEGAPY